MSHWSRFLHTQQRVSTCGVAAIRTVLHYQFGVRVAEAALVALATRPTEPILREGSGTTEMRRMVRGASTAFNGKNPWTLRTHQRGTLGQLKAALRRGRLPIVKVYIPELEDYHVFVVLVVETGSVTYFDPDPLVKPNPSVVDTKAFLDRWRDPEDASTWWAIINGGELIPHD